MQQELSLKSENVCEPQCRAGQELRSVRGPWLAPLGLFQVATAKHLTLSLWLLNKAMGSSKYLNSKKVFNSSLLKRFKWGG